MPISYKIEEVSYAIRAARERSPCNTQDVKLIAVTKTVPVERIREAVDNGILDLGENRVQELLDKVDHFSADVRWHLIGHLQTNKVKYIIDRIAMIHSLDSLRLAEEIEKRSAAVNRVTPVLVQVNMAGEETKYGLRPEEVPDFLQEVSRLSHLSVQGLMTVAPFVSDAEENRPVFRRMRELQLNMAKQALPHVEMRELSMGMSNDYVIAVEEGATMVRVGSSLFGARARN